LVQSTLLDIIAVNREDLMQGSNTALNILMMIHRNFDNVHDEQVLMSLALNDSVARMVYHADYERAIEISYAILDRFPVSLHPYFVTRHLGVIGRCQALSGQYKLAEETLHKAIDIVARQLRSSDEAYRHHADILHDLAMANDMAKGAPDVSMRYLEQALQILNNTAQEVRKGVVLMGLGNIRYGMGKVQSALEYYLLASLIFDEQSNFSNLASVDSNIGLCYTDLNIPELAESYLVRSLDLRHKIGNSDEIAISYYNLGRLFDKKGDVNQAILHYLSCRDYASRSINKYVYRLALESLEKLSQVKGDAMYAAVHSGDRHSVQTI
jgi:tetratricopeptide (TPR) repeat protein